MPHNSHFFFARRLAVALCVSGLSLSLAPVAGTTASAAVTPAAAVVSTAPGQPRLGDRGESVIALQKAIMRNGFTLKGGADGVFDRRTLRVLRTFQRVVGLRVTGVVDVPTATVLKLNVVPATSTTSSTTTSTSVPAPVYPMTVDTLPVRGAKGNVVRLVQEALAAAGLTVRGGIDGVFGSGTAASIAKFQSSKGIAPTGALDATTARALGLVAPAATQAPAATAPAKPSTNARLNPKSLPSRGSKGKSVRILQRALVNAGITVKGGIDGVFGGATAVALRTFQEKNGIPATGLFDTRTAVALGLIDGPVVSLEVFPVQGRCGYSNTWHAPRSEGRLHLGVDIIAKEGNLVYAVADGTITRVYTADRYERAGNGVRLTMADGTYFFYGHFSKIADGIGLGSPVKAGQVIGYIGKTGSTNTPHLHFEIHPGGGEAIDPTPIVAAIDACDVTTPRPVPGS